MRKRWQEARSLRLRKMTPGLRLTLALASRSLQRAETLILFIDEGLYKLNLQRAITVL